MPQAIVDGRKLRRLQGQAAVVDAMVDLLLEAGVDPTVPQVAERAGVGVATVYRYYEGIDGLRGEFVSRTLQRYGHLFDISELGVGSLEGRIQRLVEARSELYYATAPIARTIREQATQHTAFSNALVAGRQRMFEQIQEHFAPELEQLLDGEAWDLATTISTLTAFESWHIYTELGYTPHDIHRAWSKALVSLITC